MEAAPPTSLSPPRLPWLQAARGLAALFVVAYHLRGALHGTPFERLLFPGAAGVDLFFLLSGFVMVQATAASAAALADRSVDRAVKWRAAVAARFLLQRLIRVWPPYAVATLVWIAVARPASLAGLGRSLAFVPVANSDPPFFGYATLIVGWTLSYEAWFYLCFALALAASPRHRATAVALILVGTTQLLPLLLTGRSTLDPFAAPRLPLAALGLCANPLGLEFAAGALVAALVAALPPSRMSAPIGLGVAFALTLWATLALLLGFGPSHGLLAWGLPALGILVAALVAGRTARVPPRALLWLGEVSYSLYLVHPAVVRLLGGADPGSARGLVGAGGFALGLCLSLLAAAGFHRLVERPALRLARRAAAPPPVHWRR